MDARPDSAETKKKKKVVPNDIRAWTVDDKYGNMTDTYVDTLHHMFMNTDLPEGIEGHYNSLGNVGSPRLSRIFMERTEIPDFMFTDPFDMFYVNTQHFRFYNTKSPFMNVTYNWNGSRDTGSDHIKATYTNNVGKKFNFGGIFDYIYGRGYYDKQSTSYMNASFWSSYIADHYNLHLYYQHNYMKIAENGGIANEEYITNPENMAHELTSNDIPTKLSQTWNRQEHDLVFLTHHYNIGFYREEEVDSVTTRDVFVPVSKIFHTFELRNMMRNHRAYMEPENYHSYTYLPGDSTQDYTKYFHMKNLVGISLCEGFNKWALFGLNAYVGFEFNKFMLADSTRYGGFHTNTTGLVENQYYKENNIPQTLPVIEDFLAYLQANYTAISQEKPIPFTEELRHIKAYLGVEAVRYDGLLEVEYDTPHTEFRLPPLTLQPIVENAVKHGMSREHALLRITVRTSKTGEGSQVDIEDNGPGFDPEQALCAPEGAQEACIGLAKVRGRLELICGGSLAITPRPGGGTVVTISIPD